MTQSEAESIEYNTIGAFQTRKSNTQWKGNAYALQEKYTCHEFDTPVIITEDELVCPAKFITPMRKTSYWYHDPDDAIPFMLKLKQVLMPYNEFIRDKNTTDKLPSRF